MRTTRGRSGASRPGDSIVTRPELVLSGRTWIGAKIQPVDIGIGPEGRIVRVARAIEGGPRHDVGDDLILPAATDLHVHFRDPGGSPDLESFESGSVGAALGGIGLFGEMPNTIPPVTDLERLEAKEARARGRLAVDGLLYAAATTPAQVRALARRAGGFKIYLSPTTGIETPTGTPALRELLTEIARTGLPVAVHAEDPARFRPSPDHPPATTAEWAAARPTEAERSAVEEVLAAAPSGLRLHIAHVTSPAVAERIAALGHSFEATPHHLLLAAGGTNDARFKVNPPLRSEPERAGLFRWFCEGRVPVLASDHAPHSRDDKARPFALAPSGMPGVETLLPLLLERVRAGDLSIPVLLAAAMDRPARWLGVPMGRVAVGHRANLLVVDFRERRPVAASTLHAPCGWTAYENWEAIFPKEHYRDGAAIVRGGEYVGDRGGRIVRPEFAPAERSDPVRGP
ncbi:MAG TPA: amidohydrolase family protein [Thermoplasmata archaeon]|nr:amidohydrolase family protein [Thermoplasmata archaeon]